MNYDGEIVIGTEIDTSGAETGIEDLKSKLSEGKVFKRIGKDEMGNPLVEGIKVAINENAYEMTEQMEKAVTELDFQKKMNLISEQEYYEKLEDLRDNYLGKGSEQWWRYTTQIVQYEQSVVENQKKAIEKSIEEIEDKFDDVAKTIDKEIKSSVSEYDRQMKNLENKKSRFSEKLSSYGGLYKTAVFSTGEERSYFDNGVWKTDNGDVELIDIGSLKDDISVLEEYKNTLSALKERDGMTQNFFEGFKSLGLSDGIKLAKSVMSLSDESFKEYMGLWNDKRDVADMISDSLYESDEKEIAKVLEDKLERAFGEIDKTFLSEEGILWAEKFGDAFKGKITEMMDQLKTIVTDRIASINYQIALDKESGSGSTLVYNLYGSGETVSEQLKSARANTQLEYLRGGY